MSMCDIWTDATVESAIRLLVEAERLIEPFRDQDGAWGRVYEQINTFLKEEC